MSVHFLATDGIRLELLSQLTQHVYHNAIFLLLWPHGDSSFPQSTLFTVERSNLPHQRHQQIHRGRMPKMSAGPRGATAAVSHESPSYLRRHLVHPNKMFRRCRIPYTRSIHGQWRHESRPYISTDSHTTPAPSQRCQSQGRIVLRCTEEPSRESLAEISTTQEYAPVL